MATEIAVYPRLQTIKELFCDKHGMTFTEFRPHPESQEYEACSFKLNGKKVEFRSSKITPTKTGQFVTIWKRNKEGITEPFDISDDFDFMIICSKTEEKIGQFIFPKSVLREKGVISQNSKGGKRGIRVYPPWDEAENKQAEKTQSWQLRYFVIADTQNLSDCSLTKKILEEKYEVSH